MNEVPRPEVAAARRIVLKLGTRVVTHDGGELALSRLFEVVEVAAALRRAGREVLLVSSGAVGLGRDALGLAETPSELVERQACAAVGQSRLMALYEQGFGRLGLTCAQVLLTESDFDNRDHYLNLRGALARLLGHGAVPVINENDVIATDELAFVEGESRPVFSDNDRLSALVATKLGADLLVLLTDVPGLYDRDPRLHSDAQLIDRVTSRELERIEAGESRSGAGRGGMRSKARAATIAARSGCHAVIASGRLPGAVAQAVAGEAVGTWFPAQPSLSARQRWIAFATAARGVLHLDAGAVEALRTRGASLLAAGVRDVAGDFHRGDVVELRGPGGELVGRGLPHCDAEAARRWCRGERPAGARNHHALVHRNQLVLEP